MELIVEFLLETAGDFFELLLEGHLKKKSVFLLFYSCMFAILAVAAFALFRTGHPVKGTVLALFGLASLGLLLYGYRSRLH